MWKVLGSCGSQIISKVQTYSALRGLKGGPRRTAAAVIVGSEILSGRVKDENTQVLATNLFDSGVHLNHVEIVPDNKEDIAESVKRLSPKYSFVFTSGGLGPTHKDITYESVASAFGRKLERHQPTYEKIRGTEKGPLDNARARMAMLPEGAKVFESPHEWVPVVIVENVCILPGQPEAFKEVLSAQKDVFVSAVHPPMTRVVVYTALKEAVIAPSLASLQEKYPNVNISSYPRFGAPSIDAFSTVVLVEADSDEDAKAVAEEVTAAVDGVKPDSD